MLLLLLFIMHRIAGAASRAHIYLSSASIERNSMGKKRFDLILDARDISFFFLLPSRRSSPRVTFVFGIRFVLIFIFESFLYIIFSCSIRNHISSIVLYQFIGTADIVIYLPIYYSCVEGLVFFFRYVDGKWKPHRILNIYFLSGIIFLCLRCSHRACTAMKCVNCLAINENASNIYSNNVSINSHGTTI